MNNSGFVKMKKKKIINISSQILPEPREGIANKLLLVAQLHRKISSTARLQT